MPITRFKDEKEKEEYLKQLKQQQQANLQEANRRNQEATSKFNEIASNSNNNNSTDSNSLWNQIKTTASNNFNNSNNLTFGFDDTIQGNKQASNFLKGLAKDSGYGRNNGFKTSNTANDYMKQALELNKRSQDLQAQEEAKEKDKDSSVLSKVGDFFKNLLSGATQGSANLAQGYADTMAMLEKNLSKDKTSRLDEQIKASPYVNDELNYENKVNANRENTVDKLIGNVGNTIGNMIPSIVVGQATGSAFSDVGGKIGSAISKNASNMAMATQVLGNETANTQLDGQDFNKSYVTGLAKSAVSFATEKLTGGDILSKGTSLDDMAKKYVVNKFKSDWGKRLATAGLNIAGEVTEENLENQLNYVVDKVINNKDMPDLKNWWNDASETTKTTFFTTALMQLVGLGGSSYKDYVDTDNMNKNDTKNYQKAFDEVKKVVNNTNNTNDANSNNVNYLNSNVNTQTNTQQDIANRLNEIVKNDKYISQEDKQAMIEATNNLASNNQLDNNNTLDAINQIRQISQLSQEHNDQLDTGKKYLSGRKEIYNKYRNVTDYDNSIVQQAKDVIPSNKQGKRTKEQWLDVAKYIGTNIADKSNSEIQKIAYKSWQEETPNNSATLNKQGQKYVKFMSDDWIDTIYDAVEKQRQKSGYVANNDTVNALDNLYNEYTNNQTVQNNNIQNNIDTSKMNLVDSAKAYNLNGNDETIQSINQKLNDRGIASRFDGNLFKNDDGTPNKNINALWRTNTDENGNTRREIVFNPYVDGDINEQKTMQQVTIHEMLHDMAGDKQVRSDLFNLILDKNKKRDGYGDARSNLEEMYSQVYDKNSKDFKDLVDEEEVADTLAQKLGDQDFINSLNEEKPNVFKRIYDWVVDKLNQFTGSKNEKIYWEDVKNKFESAYKREANNEILSKNILRYSLDDKQRNKISKISKNAIDEKGNLKAFKQQLQEYKDKKLPTGVELIVAKDNDGLRYAQVSDKPIVMNQSNINKILINKHSNIDSTILENIDEELQNSVFAMDSRSRKNSKVIVLDKVDNNGNPIIATIYENKKSANIEVNELTSVYEKNKFQNLINSTAKEGYNCYTNKKTNDWLLRNRLQLPTRFAETLVSTNSIPTSNNNVNTTNNNSMQESENNSVEIQRRAIANKLKEKGAQVDNDGNVTLYHITTKENYDKINKDGYFKANDSPIGGMTGEEIGPRSFFSYDKDWVETWRQSNDSKIMEVKVPAEYIRQGAKNEKEIYIEGQLKRRDNGTWTTDKMPTSTFYDRKAVKEYLKKNSTAKPSIEQSGAWQSFLENQIGQTGKGKTVQELRLPIKETINSKKIDAYNVLYQDKDQTSKTNLPISEGGKTRKHYKSIMQSSNTSPEAKAIAKELIGSDTYIPDSNARQLATADNRIMSNGADNEAVTLATKVKNNDKITADDIAVGERLIEYYSKTGEKEKLQDAIQNVALAGTQAGQTVQAMSLINRQTPQGQAVYLSKVVDRMNKEIKKRTKGKGQQFNLTPEMLDKITNSSKENLEKNIDEVARELAKQVPKTTMEKIDSWRYFSMLANPRTHIRNIIGNLSMASVQRIKNKVAGGLEAIAQKTGMIDKRTKTLKPASKEVKAFAKADVENVLGRLNNESKFDTKNLIQQYQRTFKSNLLENTLGKLYNLNSKALEAEDTFGLKSAYRKAMADYMTANKLTEKDLTAGTKEADTKLENARKYAIQQAQEATFHQYSSVASLLNTLENKNKATKLLTGAIIPFKKTPINVAKTGIEYSPIGIVKSFTTDIAKLRKGDINVNQYIDNLAKGLTGTGITLAGYALAQSGILSASGDEDDQKNQYYQQDRGNQSFSLKIGDKTYSLDWLSPTAIPLFIGAQLNDNVKNAGEEQTTEDMLDKISNNIDAMASAMNPMIEMSMLSGVASAVKSFAQGDAQFFQNLAINSAKSYVNQFFPTLGGQIAKMVDDTERTTTSTKQNMFAKAVDSTGRQILNKIPFASKLLPAKTDVWGNELKREPNKLYRALQQAVFPWTEKTLKSTNVDNSISDLYEKTGDNSVLPNTSINKDFTINSEKYRLTSDEYANYKKQYGKTSYNLLNKLTSSSEYKNMTDEQKTKAISEIYSYANEKNKIDYANKNNIKDVKTSTTYNTIEQIKQDGGNESDYFKYVGSTLGANKQEEKINILNNMNISNKSKSAIYKGTFGKDDDVYNMVLSKNGIDINEYLKYKTQKFTSDKKDDGTLTGKTITNSKKNKVFDYVNNMKLSYENRLVLLGQQYKLSTKERKDLFNYINTIKINKDDKLKFLNKCQGFTVYKDGTVEY